MPVSHQEIFDLIKNMHLFRKLSSEEVEKAAAMFEPVRLQKGEVLFREGDVAAAFFVVYSGRVKELVHHDGQVHATLTLVTADYFGLETLEKNQRRTVTVVAEEETLLLRMEREKFFALLRAIPSLVSFLNMALTSRRLSQRFTFDWIYPDEVIYLMVRKHRFFMWVGLIAPVLLLLMSMGAFVALFVSQAGPIPVAGAAALGVIAVLWGAWNVVDWGNDYYLVTNQRAIWLERVVGIYDSREEAPLSMLLSVSTNTDQLGRILGYGDVVLRTYTGTIIFHRADHPQQIAPIIEEYWGRARITSKAVENVKMEEALRQRLGLPPLEIEPAQPAEPASAPAPPPQPKRAPGFLERFFGNIYRVRFEENGVVTYRKHWFALIIKTWQPAFWLLMCLVVAILRPFGYLAFFSVTATLLLVGIFFLLFFTWYVYQYVDWRNDIYQVTPEQVVDIYRKPLGKEEKRSAPLENILSIEYTRRNLIALLLNFGTVTINVGTAKLDFDYVFDPSRVQQELFHFMLERKQRLKDQATADERERVTEWIAAYHRMEEELRRRQNPPQSGGFPG